MKYLRESQKSRNRLKEYADKQVDYSDASRKHQSLTKTGRSTSTSYAGKRGDMQLTEYLGTNTEVINVHDSCYLK